MLILPSPMIDALPKNHYCLKIVVSKDDIDEFNHVNNEVYLKWMITAAIAHSESLGYTFAKFREQGGVFVVRRHEIDYLRPAFLGERLSLYTWSEPMEGTRALRIYKLSRDTDEKLLLSAQTQWAFVNPDTGKPTPVPQIIRDAYASN